MVDPTVLTVCGAIGPLSLRVRPGSVLLHRLGIAFGRSAIVDFGAENGDETGRIDGAEAVVVAGIRPDEIWLIGTRARVGAAWATMAAEPAWHEARAVDLAPGVATFHLTGPSAPSVLEKLCSVDWSYTMTPDGAAVSAGVAKVGCDIVRADGFLSGPAPGYLIMCGRSYGHYLEGCLIDAGQEFDLVVRPYSLPN